MNTKKHVLIYLAKNFFSGVLIILGGLSAIYGVIAFESLSTTPGTTGNQSLGSQILSIANGGGFDRTTDSLEAISNTVNTNYTNIATVDTKVTALSGGGVSWAGYTTSTYGGGVGYTKGFADKCNTDFPGSKPMTYQDWLNLGSDYPSTSNARLIDGSYTTDYNGIDNQFLKDGYYFNATLSQYPMCRGWAYTNSSYYGPYITTTGYINLAGCATNFKLPCVYK